MSRDATGIYSAHAVRSSTCPVCRSGRGEPCNLDVPGYAEHGTHWERTETAPPYDPNPEWSAAIDMLYLVLGRVSTEELSDEELGRADEVARRLRALKAQALEEVERPLREMQAAKAAAEKRIRDAFQETYGAFWKCRRCGSYIGPRNADDFEPRGYVCQGCGSTDNMAHGYSDAREEGLTCRSCGAGENSSGNGGGFRYGSHAGDVRCWTCIDRDVEPILPGLPERVAIVGSRDFPDLEAVRAYVRALPRGTVIVSGGARGVDRAAAQEGRRLGLEVVELFADWDRLGRRAGIVRNRRVLDFCDRVVAFWDGVSRGTRDVIEEARRRGIPVEVRPP